MPFKARVQYNGASDDVSLWIVSVDERPDGKRSAAKLVWEEFEYGAFVAPTLEPAWHGPSNRDFLQVIVDAAYEAGIRPTAADVKGETAALRGHLTDMRALAFGALKIGAPTK